MTKLNLGCGPNWEDYEGYEGLDIVDFGQKYVTNVLDFVESGQVRELYDEVMAYHFLEHFSQDELKRIFSGVWSMLRMEGIFKFIVPHRKKAEAWVLSHKTFWDEETVRWLTREDASKVYGFGRWELVELVLNNREDIYARLKKIQ